MTQSCSQLFITPNSTSTVITMKLNLNLFQADYSKTLPYVQQTGWGGILGDTMVESALNSFRTYNYSALNPIYSQDTKYFWSVVNTTNGIDIKLCRVIKVLGYYFISDWAISYQAYPTKTGLHSDALWYTSYPTSLIWPSDGGEKAPNYVLLGRSSIVDFIPSNGTAVFDVPKLDYEDPYPLPPSPAAIKFMFNENMTREKTTSYANVYMAAVRVDVPLFLVILLAIFVAAAIVALYVRKRPAVRYFDWPLIKLIVGSYLNRHPGT